MYIPSPFRITDEKLIAQFIRENGFATLVTGTGTCPTATHIPVELETNANGEQVLRGHLSRANPHWKEFAGSPQALVIFLSPVHHYISSSWYNHPNAPTWNYLSVHVTGRIKILDQQTLWDSVRRLTDRYEEHSKNPVSLDRLPEQVQKQMNGIIGFEVAMEQVNAIFKLSQNREEEDYQNIIRELQANGSFSAQLMADMMQRRLSVLR